MPLATIRPKNTIEKTPTHQEIDYFDLNTPISDIEVPMPNTLSVYRP